MDRFAEWLEEVDAAFTTSSVTSDSCLEAAVTECIRSRTSKGLPLVAELRLYVEAAWRDERREAAKALPAPAEPETRPSVLQRIREEVAWHSTRTAGLPALHAQLVRHARLHGHSAPKGQGYGLTEEGSAWVREEYARAVAFSREHGTTEGFEPGRPPLPAEPDPLRGVPIAEIAPEWTNAEEAALVEKWPHLKDAVQVTVKKNIKREEWPPRVVVEL